MSEAIPQDIDQDRIEGLHSTEGVAYVVGKPAEDLEEIEPIPGARGAFHRNAQGSGYYFVSIEKRSCTCPSYRFNTGLIAGICKHIRALEDRQQEEPIPLYVPSGKQSFAEAPI